MKSILGTIRESKELLLMAEVIEIAGLEDLLDDEGPFTVFVPRDWELEQMPSILMEEIREDPDVARDVMTYHIVQGRMGSEDILQRRLLTTIGGEELTIGDTSQGTLVNGSMITTSDIECTNGTIHVINHMLLPCLLRSRNLAH